jgi:methyl-accepting chemotaxis protein
VSLVAISADTQEDSRGFIKDAGLRVPLLADPELKVISEYGVAMEGKNIAVPSTFVLDESGAIRWHYVGENMKDRPTAQILLDQAAGLASK